MNVSIWRKFPKSTTSSCVCMCGHFFPLLSVTCLIVFFDVAMPRPCQNRRPPLQSLWAAPPSAEAVFAVRQARGGGGDCGGRKSPKRHADPHLDRLPDGGDRRRAERPALHLPPLHGSGQLLSGLVCVTRRIRSARTESNTAAAAVRQHAKKLQTRTNRVSQAKSRGVRVRRVHAKDDEMVHTMNERLSVLSSNSAVQRRPTKSARCVVYR